MRPINLTLGKIAVVDDADYNWLTQYSWYAKYNKCTDSFYAARTSRRKDENGKRFLIYMHRQLLGLEKGDRRVGDHKNHNTLDNRRDNIWTCTYSQNQLNRKDKK